MDNAKDKINEKELKEMLDKMPEKYRDKETFLSDLRSADPDKMNWMMLNYLVQKMYDNVQGEPEWQSENDLQQRRNRYSGGVPYNGGSYRDNSSRYSPVRRMSGVGQVYRNYSGESMEEREESICRAKERLGEIVGQTLNESDIKCLICREAGNLINKICKDETFNALKEFNELCIAMKGYAQMLPEELETRAKEEAISKYAEMLEYSGGNRNAFRASVMYDGDFADGRRIDGRGFREHHRGAIPTVEIAEFGRRGRDSMGRYK